MTLPDECSHEDVVRCSSERTCRICGLVLETVIGTMDGFINERGMAEEHCDTSSEMMRGGYAWRRVSLARRQANALAGASRAAVWWHVVGATACPVASPSRHHSTRTTRRGCARLDARTAVVVGKVGGW